MVCFVSVFFILLTFVFSFCFFFHLLLLLFLLLFLLFFCFFLSTLLFCFVILMLTAAIDDEHCILHQNSCASQILIVISNASFNFATNVNNYCYKKNRTKCGIKWKLYIPNGCAESNRSAVGRSIGWLFWNCLLCFNVRIIALLCHMLMVVV